MHDPLIVKFPLPSKGIRESPLAIQDRPKPGKWLTIDELVERRKGGFYCNCDKLNPSLCCQAQLATIECLLDDLDDPKPKKESNNQELPILVD